ncbi:UNVERIFIED_CONTAM: hypothetical protein RMT77_009929 [Armadillidium vulgare]
MKMALNKKEITVLCPNGRRVNIKTTSSTSIGQIIEEACIKQELDPLNYNIKHLKRILDPSNTIQYSNIPNRAQLELVEAEKRRQELNVIVNLVTNEGQRLIHEFSSSSLLWDVLIYHDTIEGNDFSLPYESSNEEPFIVYTMRKFSGEELKSVTLKSLGLYGGKCMMRYNTQQKETNNEAKGTSSPVVIVSKTTKTSSKSSHKDDSTANDEASSSSLQIDSGTKKIEKIINTEESSMETESEEPEIQPTVSNPSQNETSNADVVSQLENRSENLVSEERESYEMECQNTEEVNIVTEEKVNSNDVVNIEKNEASIPIIIPLSDHDSILFSLDDAPSKKRTEEEDSFFELTSNEVRKLYNEHVQKIKELEEAPLQTHGMRQLEKDSRLLLAMNRYPVTQIRIIFPDRLAIQANFKPRNTVKDIIDFLKPLLVRSDLNFYLYTTHPRRVLDPASSLVEADCIPKALIYFGTEEDLPSYLNEESLSKKSSFDAASKSVVKSKNRQASYESGNTSGSSSSIPERISLDSREQRGGEGAKVKSSQKPKWFKLGK